MIDVGAGLWLDVACGPGGVRPAGICGQELLMVDVQGGSCLEWLAAAGWKVELDGSTGRVRGSATKAVDGIAVEVSGEAETVDALAWRLVEWAADELEAAADAQDAAVAA